jgi:hypothetical protein
MRAVTLPALALLAGLAATPGLVQAQSGPPLHTNQAFIEDATATSTLAIDDPMAVFGFVLRSLPDRVKVYPTENHYYFAFFHNGVRYAGNIKIDARTRDQGKIHFVYYEDVAGGQDGRVTDVALDASRGVTVERAAPIVYRVTYAEKSVLFELNDLSNVKPPPAVVAPDEKFIGPIFDESGVRFFLMFNERLKIFLYVLDETVTPTDVFVPIKESDSILIGKRTRFALYRDDRLDRKIMIGALADNVAANNYFDGPFDQMPDNFHRGDEFRQALYAAEPGLQGKIDAFGAFPDGARYGIVTYMSYRQPSDLMVFRRCATDKRVPPEAYYGCFVLGSDDQSAKAVPLSLDELTR